MADIFQIIKYEGDNDTLIWKSDIENFNTGTQLIVHESQEAVFFMNGKALDLFGPGRHTIETQNIPLIRKFLNKPTNDQTSYHCEIYFINKTEQMIKWGTAPPVEYMDSVYKFPLEISAGGEMFIRVEDSRKLLVKIVGTEKELAHAVFIERFRAFWMSKVKSCLAKTMQESSFSIFEVDAHMDEISEALHQQLIPDYKDYGLSLEKFLVTRFVKPVGNMAYESAKDIHIRQYTDVANAKLRRKVGRIDEKTNANRLIIESAAIAQKRAQEGYTYQSERAYDTAEKVAQNEGIGNFSSAGIGLGMMGGVAGGMGSVIAGITTDALNPAMPQQVVVKSDSANPTVEFGETPPIIDLKSEDSTPSLTRSDDMTSFKQKIDKLRLMKEAGILSDDEFNTEKQKLLDSL